MQLTVKQAAEAYGVARSTIHRAVRSGRLSGSTRADGVQVIDLAELIRVYGEPPYPPAERNAEDNAADAQAQQALVEELQELRREVAALREELAQQRALPPPQRASIIEAVRERLATWIRP